MPKSKLVKKLDKIMLTQDHNSIPYHKIRLQDFNWMKETIKNLEKENEQLKEENSNLKG